MNKYAVLLKTTTQKKDAAKYRLAIIEADSSNTAIGKALFNSANYYTRSEVVFIDAACTDVNLSLDSESREPLNRSINIE